MLDPNCIGWKYIEPTWPVLFLFFRCNQTSIHNTFKGRVNAIISQNDDEGDNDDDGDEDDNAYVDGDYDDGEGHKARDRISVIYIGYRISDYRFNRYNR